MGSRALRHWLTQPPRERGSPQRHDAIEALLRRRRLEPLREALRGVSDVERITARIALRQVRPRELAGLRARLAGAARAAAAAPRGASACRHAVREAPASARRDSCDSCCSPAIADEPAVLLRDGGVIAPGVDAELDELRAIGAATATPSCSTWKRASARRTGIANLRVQFNKVHGFYIEVTQGQLGQGARRLPSAARR